MARVKAQGCGGSAHNQDQGERPFAQAPRSSSFLRPLSFLLCAGVLLAAGAALWGQDVPGPRARGALQAAREAYKRGDYDAAEFCLSQIQPSRGGFGEDECKELADLTKRNRVALGERREGGAQLLHAEDALNKGRPQEAAALVRALSVNQYLREEDRQRLRQLTERLRAGSPAPPGVPPLPGGKEDQPTLTAAARGALQRGEIDQAEQLAHQAENAPSSLMWRLQPWGDSPTKVLRDVEAARHKQAEEAALRANPRPPEKQEATSPLLAPLQSVKNLFSRSPAAREQEQPANSPQPNSGPPPGQNPAGPGVAVATGPAAGPVTQNTQYRPSQAPPPAPAPAPEYLQATALVRQGFAALNNNDLAAAQRFADQADSLHAQFQWWDEFAPAKLRQQIASRRPAPAQPAGAPPGQPLDPRQLVREGRTRLRDGQLDEADRLSLRAAAVAGTRWGLFEDSPDKLRNDIQKARARQDKDEAARLLAEARRQFDKGDRDQAKSLALRAKQLHGPYSMWELGDRPDRLLSTIRRAEARDPRKGRPPEQGRDNAVAQGNGTRDPRIEQGGPGPVDRPPLGAALDARQRASALVKEARALHRESKLAEAYARALEASRWGQEAERGGARFGPNEDTPAMVQLDLSTACQRHIELMVRRAEGCLNGSGGREPAAFQRAATALNEARQLAIACKLDMGGIEAKAAELRQLQQYAQGQPSPPPPPPGGLAPEGVTVAGGVPGALANPRQVGLELLAKARLELTHGELHAARLLGEQVYMNKSYGLEAAAEAFLRSVDAEANNQLHLAANHKFDQANDAFRRRDFGLARTILAALGSDERMLTPERLAVLREISAQPEMQPGGGKTAAPGGLQLIAKGPGAPGTASVSDVNQPTVGPGGPPEEDVARRFKDMEEVLHKKLSQDSSQATVQAMACARARNYDEAIDSLQALIVRVESSSLTPDKASILIRPAQKRIAEYRTLREQEKWEKERLVGLPNAESREKQRALDLRKKQDQLGDMVKQAHTLIREKKYDQAKILALKMKDVDPDSVTADAILTIINLKRNLELFEENKTRQEEYFIQATHEAENVGPWVDGFHKAVDFDKKIHDQAMKRPDLGRGIEGRDRRGDMERRIERRLLEPISLNFKDVPLGTAIETLREMTSMNVVADLDALKTAGVNLNQQLTLKIDASLKSALNILLRQVQLTYVVKDEALQITTEDGARGKQKTITYPVADLVVPVENHSLPYWADFNHVAEKSYSANGGLNYGGVMPFVGPGSIPMGPTVSNPNTGTGYAGAGNANHGGGGAPLNGPSKPPGSTIEDQLIRLITHIIEPGSWGEVGGKGAIQYFPLGLALVINQTQDIQEQIQDLLAALRRLQDLEVAIEMRLVSVSESFFEMMRVDFDINITNSQTRYAPQLLSQQFAPPGYINAFQPNGFFSGLTPAGTFTPDLGIPIKNSSFDFALPPFGGYPGTLGADGGLTLGLAFLSDIQVFMLLEAAQGDRRYNVMQAPKITVFNGQAAFIQVQDAQFFLTQINVVPFGSQLVFQPQNSPVFFGIGLNVTPVVSADRRFVRLNLNPSLSNLFSANVPLVPIQIPVNDLFLDSPTVASTEPRIFQTFFQQPAVGTISLNTTVVIPDGGTVLLGGLKALSEGRNEFGPPILSKIPYLNRLFKNVGYGRETQSLMILVTARIIINEEEEQIFNGTLQPIPR